MTVGAVEAITDVGPAILLRVDDHLVTKSDLFTQLTAWNGFWGGRNEFYRGAAVLSLTSFLALDPSILA
jgi:anti-sigma-K factor RskA